MQWLIDGHNLIGHMPTLRLDDPDDEAKLVEYLRSYQGRTGQRITVIFDAGSSYRPAATKKAGGITVQFVASGQTADQIISQRVRRIQNPQEFIVVSSDRAVQQAARQVRVRVLTAQEFAGQLLRGSPALADDDRGSQAEVKLSADEIDEWLKVFKKQKK
jgi:predicted RNA-binding protein with PIN domain